MTTPASGRSAGTAFEFLDRDRFKSLADLVLNLSTGEHTSCALSDASGGTTRFANNQVIQHVDSRRITLAVTVAFGRRHGTATTTDFGEEAVRDMVARAEAIAKVSPEDPEYLPPLPPQTYDSTPRMREETRAAGPHQRVALVAQAVDLCRQAGMTAAGIVSSSAAAVGLAASTGLFAYEPRTEAKFSLTATAVDSSGWAANVHRSIDELGVVERTRLAIEKAKRAATPREIEPGHYTVILEPSALAGLIGPMIWEMDAKSYYKHTSPFEGKLGTPILDGRLSLFNRPNHASLVGGGFNQEGLPAKELAWIERGVLKSLRYDRFTAHEQGVDPTPSFDAPALCGTPLGQDLAAKETAGAPISDPKAASLEDLIAGTERGILVSNFWYIRTVNPTDLTLTGMTRDGTFLIESGQLSTGLVNFRWHDSPLRALAQVDGFTAPADAVSNENWKMILPALKLPDFHFSSVTRF
jgi:predicted Zn-dependent protease